MHLAMPFGTLESKFCELRSFKGGISAITQTSDLVTVVILVFVLFSV